MSQIKWSDLRADVWSNCPDAEFGEDNDGQVVIYTGLRESQDGQYLTQISEITERVVLVAFIVRAGSSEAAQKRIEEELQSVHGLGWWIAEDKRYDGSDNESAIFIHGDYTQDQARQILTDHLPMVRDGHPTAFLRDGSYGDAAEMIVVDTIKFTESDWEAIDAEPDHRRGRRAKEIANDH